MKLRIQICIYHELVAEMVGEPAEVHQFWTDWVNNRLKQGYSAGGSVINRADLPRAWDVPIGSDVRTSEQIFDRR